MNATIRRSIGAALASSLFVLCGCGPQTRGSDDAYDQSKAAAEERGVESRTGAAGEPKAFGDTVDATRKDGVSPSASQSGISDRVEPERPSPRTPPPPAGTAK